MRKLVALVLVALGVLLLTPAVASASTPTLKSLAKIVKALKKTEKSQAAAIKSLKTKVAAQASTIADLQSVVGGDASHGLQLAVSDLQINLANLSTTVAGQATTLTDHADVLALEPYVRVTSSAIDGVSGPNVVFQSCNLQIKSPTNESDDSGLGNLIVGWNDPPPSATEGYRAGSNNLVCGDENSFTSHGGFVAGLDNTVSNFWTSVSGGGANAAGNAGASVSGGTMNAASGEYASVSGGDENTASGMYDTVSGGEGNTAGPASHTTVSGGNSVTENTAYGWSAGGSFHNP
ncbi:MAG: hypothetical protein ABR941_05920 [Thermoleophilia bacterium]|jgi:hypothetical protein